jgi:DNA topoisomerase III
MSSYFGQPNEVVDDANNNNNNEIRFTSEPVLECYCKSQMVLKSKKENKGFYIGCRGYPDCRNSIWLPNSIIEAQVTDEYCDKCKPKRVKKLKFKFERGSVPQHIPLDYITCILCDQELRECLQIQIKSNAVTNESSNTRFPIPSSTITTTTHRNQAPTSRPAPPPQPSQHFRNRSLDDSNNNNNNNDSDNPIYCHCSNLAALKSVRKEGPNQGRQFYSCGQNSCSFFAWKDAADTNQSTFSQPATISRNTNPSLNRNDTRNSLDGVGINCNCGKPAIMLVSLRKIQAKLR